MTADKVAFRAFFPGKSQPEHILRMELAIPLFRSAHARYPLTKEAIDFRGCAVVICAGKVQSHAVQFEIGDGYIATVLRRGDRHLIDLGFGETLGVMFTGNGEFAHQFGADVQLAERAHA